MHSNQAISQLQGVCLVKMLFTAVLHTIKVYFQLIHCRTSKILCPVHKYASMNVMCIVIIVIFIPLYCGIKNSILWHHYFADIVKISRKGSN